MRHYSFVSDGSIFSRTRLVSYRFIVTSYQSSLIFSSCYKQAILERVRITPSSIEDFASSRRHIDSLSVWTMFQLFSIQLCWRATARRGVVRCFQKGRKNKKTLLENPRSSGNKTMFVSPLKKKIKRWMGGTSKRRVDPLEEKSLSDRTPSLD